MVGKPNYQFYYRASKDGKDNGKFDIFSNTKLDPIPEGYEYIPSICNPGCEKNVGDDGIIDEAIFLEPSLKVQMELDQHEAECALRYEMVNKTLEQLDKRLWRLEAIVICI